MAAFCPIMQYHSEFNEHRQPSNDRTPWNIQALTGDPDVIPTFRFFANLRMNLLPYVWSEAIKSSRSGVPMMRALPLEFPEDPKVFDYPFQYMFGDGLLVAPVAWEGCNTLEVYLPVRDGDDVGGDVG
jgi:alpha-glucosidase (family GH31 glycosyl hydrolase)